MIILAAVASYTVAVVLKPFWDWLPTRKKEAHSAVERFLICRVRQELPEEAYKLVKLLAEMNLCEVMIVGLSVLLVVRASFPIADPGDLVEMRIVLAVVLLCIIAFYRWRRHLREEYDTDLENLGKLLKEKPEGATFE